MAVICNWVLRLFTLAYLVALFLFLADNFGGLGVDTGPLANLLLVPLGWPWNGMLDAAPLQLRSWLAAGAPVVNIVFLYFLCGVLERSGRV